MHSGWEKGGTHQKLLDVGDGAMSAVRDCVVRGDQQKLSVPKDVVLYMVLCGKIGHCCVY